MPHLPLSLLSLRLRGNRLPRVSSGPSQTLPPRKAGGRGCLAGGCRTRSHVRSRGSLAAALPRGSRSSARTHTALLPAEHRLPARRSCLSQPPPACHFPPGKGLTAGSPGKKKKSYRPVFSYRGTCHPPAPPQLCPRPVLPPPGTACRTIHRLRNSCRLPARQPAHTAGTFGQSLSVCRCFRGRAAPEPHKICQPPPAGSEKSWQNPKRSNTAPFLSF